MPGPRNHRARVGSTAGACGPGALRVFVGGGGEGWWGSWLLHWGNETLGRPYEKTPATFWCQHFVLCLSHGRSNESKNHGSQSDCGGEESGVYVVQFGELMYDMWCNVHTGTTVRVVVVSSVSVSIVVW